MKALIVFKEDDTDNLFVHILCQAISAQNVDVHCSLQDFWEDNTHYDIIHFQWPEEVVGWNCTDVSVIGRLKERIAYLKAQGSKFVYTRHNTCPHYSNPIIKQAYDIIESCTDLVVHMGDFSYHSFLQKYPDSSNKIIPHHIYENTYDETISCEAARQKLHIPDNGFVVTAFGKFRNREEVSMTINSFLKLRIPGKYLLAPRMLPFSQHPRHKNILKRTCSFLAYYFIPFFLKLRAIRAGMNEDIISNKELPYYIAASDVIFVQRKRILNSGNIPLAFLFKKVVIGPDSGNVGELLKETGNPTFNPNDTGSIVQALKQAYQLVQAGKGNENYLYAQKHMGLEKVANEYVSAYKSVLSSASDTKHL